MRDTYLKAYDQWHVAARKLGVSPRTLARYEHQPDGLPSIKIGGRKFFRKEAIAAWLKARERRPNPRRHG